MNAPWSSASFSSSWWAVPVVLAAATAGSGCASSTPPIRTAAPPVAPPPPPSLTTPASTWRQLARIEAWLEGPGPRHYPAKRVEAELLLAEGRLSFAKEDAGRAPEPTLERRLRGARSGFRRVLSDPRSSALQRHRARRGLDSVRTLESDRAGDEGPPTLAVRPRSTWGARRAVPARMTFHRGGWTRITIHHSAPAGGPANLSTPGAVQDELRRIQRFHMDQSSPPFGDIGYHFLIDPAGSVYQGRELTWRGAHSKGANNRGNIGICLLGDFDQTRPSPAVLASLERLLDELTERHGIPRTPSRILGHGELKATACPGTHLMRWIESYRR